MIYKKLLLKYSCVINLVKKQWFGEILYWFFQRIQITKNLLQ